jgi:DNA/RNA-binding domain of Phe-tRNA-synthetase-like protein
VLFHHSPQIWSDFPELAAGVLVIDGVTPDADVADQVAAYQSIADGRLASGTESDLPEIQAWRRTFTKMGLKPTQYRCASEALLRRYRKERNLPQIHPLIDLCNAVSLAFAIPVAVFDVSNVAEYLEVRHATGEETYLTFGGEIENPESHEVIFADAQQRAHARRWTNRQSGLSAMRPDTSTALIVSEAMHDTAAVDVVRLVTTLSTEAEKAGWKTAAGPTSVSQDSPRFEF